MLQFVRAQDVRRKERWRNTLHESRMHPWLCRLGSCVSPKELVSVPTILTPLRDALAMTVAKTKTAFSGWKSCTFPLTPSVRRNLVPSKHFSFYWHRRVLACLLPDEIQLSDDRAVKVMFVLLRMCENVWRCLNQFSERKVQLNLTQIWHEFRFEVEFRIWDKFSARFPAQFPAQFPPSFQTLTWRFRLKVKPNS